MECICQRDCFVHGRRYRPGDKEEFVKCPKHFKTSSQLAKENKVLVEASKSEEDRLKDIITSLQEDLKVVRTKNADLINDCKEVKMENAALVDEVKSLKTENAALLKKVEDGK